jgi:hypothetical protein
VYDFTYGGVIKVTWFDEELAQVTKSQVICRWYINTEYRQDMNELKKKKSENTGLVERCHITWIT